MSASLPASRDARKPGDAALPASDGHGPDGRGLTLLARRLAGAGESSRALLGALLDVVGSAGVLGVAEITEDGVQEANDAYRQITGSDDAGRPAAWPPAAPLSPASSGWSASCALPSVPSHAASAGDALALLRNSGSCGPYWSEWVDRDGTRVPVLIGAAVTGRDPLRWLALAIDARAPGSPHRGDRGKGAQAHVPAHAQAQASRKARERLDFLLRVRERNAELARKEERRRALQLALRQAERMQAVGHLASAIAHDFGNLLGAISGYAEMAEEAGKNLDPEIGTVLGEIRDTADRALRLTRDLLGFGSRGARAEPVAVDVNAIITGIRGLLGISISGRGTLALRLSPAPLPLVLADRIRLEQVLLNLVINARDAMPEGGTITIGTAAAVLGEDAVRGHPWARPGRYVELSVQDTGTGMSPDVQARIFERQYTTKAADAGGGLGLSTVRAIIAEAGGVIEVDSQEGKGTTFRLYLRPVGGRGAPGRRAPA